MKNFKLEAYKLVITILGISFFAFALLALNLDRLDYKLLLLSIFTIVFASKLNLVLPKSGYSITFSDSMIFLTFLLYGGEYAIILASLDTLINCLYMKSKGNYFHRLMIPFNVGLSSITISASYIVTTYLGCNFSNPPTPQLIINLGILATIQFISASFFLSIYISLQNKTNFFQVWKDQFFSSSITYFLGSGIAGIIFKLIEYKNFTASLITFCIVTMVYFVYRNSIKELTNSIEQAEAAERARADVEMQRAEQAEKHIEELNVLLIEQERISSALLKSKDEFRFAAMHDNLTGLANRTNLLEKINLQMKLKLSEISSGFFVIYMDISQFKLINDRYGRAIGDELLNIISKRLIKLNEHNSFIARLGSDKFALILENTQDSSFAESITKSMISQLNKTYSIQRQKLQPKFFVSIVPFTDQHSPEEILRDADFTVRYAKEKKLNYTLFDKELRANYLYKIKLETDVAHALRNKEFLLYYQPIISLSSGKIIGFEALLRWITKERGFVSPAEFIPILEDSGQIIPVTNWILNETVQQLQKWQALSKDTKDLMISVNISGKHLTDDSLVKTVQKILNKTNLYPPTLKLEITESSAMENSANTVQLLNKLKKLGVQLSIDDFGTGYSSLSQLQKLPFDTLKIDRSFVNDAVENQENLQILHTIVALAKSLNLRIIAEGIETIEQLQILSSIGCDYGQGFLFAKPMPKEQIDKMFETNQFYFDEIEQIAPENTYNFISPIQNIGEESLVS
jgi:diguanylate cyclase (GGDEF)-like protein